MIPIVNVTINLGRFIIVSSLIKNSAKIPSTLISIKHTPHIMNEKEIASKIFDLCALIEHETSYCGSNASFYTDIAVELNKLCPYAIHKLHNITNISMVLNTLKD